MPYKLQPSSSGYFVVNDRGERKNKQPMSRSRALRFLRALYVNVSDATVKAVTPIVGNLGRSSTSGQFAAVGSSDASKARKLIQDLARKQQQKQAKKKPAKGKSKRASAKKPAAKKQAAPKKTDAQKEQERQAKLAQRQAEREQRRKEAEAKKKQERRENDKKVAEGAGLGKDTHDALTEFANPDEKIQLSPKNAADLEKRGLVEKDASGEYRMTQQGRTYVDAAKSGDVRRAADAISEGSDNVVKNQQRATEKQARTDAQAKRRADVEARRAEREAKQKEKQAKGGGGGGKAKPSEADKQAQKDQQRVSNRQSFAPQAGVDSADAEELAQSAMQPGTPNDRLIAAGLQNDQGEATDQGRRFLSAVERGDLRGAQAALQDARQRQERNATRNERQQRISQRRQNRSIRRVKASLDEPATLSVFKAQNGQWRWLIRSGSAFLDRDREIFSRKALIDAVERNRERGYYGPLRWWHCGEIDTVARKAGPGLDIGDCDFSGVIGRTLVESGTFRAERYARAAQEHAANLKASLGVVYKPLDISADRVYDRLDIVERSLCPADKARNQLSGSLHVFQR
jgi:hypothetical protein